MRGGFRKRLRQVLSSSAAAGARLLSPPGLTDRGGPARPGPFDIAAGAVWVSGVSPSMRAGGRRRGAHPSRAARGLAASSLLDFRAGVLLGVRPVLLGVMVSMLPLPSAASGVGVELGDADPCLGRALTRAEFHASLAEPALFDELWPLFLGLQAERCAGVDRFPALSDLELMRRVFDGSTVARASREEPAVVPLPGAIWAMLAGLIGLAVARRRA